MIFIKQIESHIKIKTIGVSVAVRYDEEDIPNNFPFRDGDMWNVKIDVEKQSIIGWPSGITGGFYMKICDQGTYTLFDEDDHEVACIQNNYVPNALLPGEYGDYLEMIIDDNGLITNWLSDANFSNFSEAY